MSTQDQTDGFFLPSKEEQEKEAQGGQPLIAEDYIVKVAKIDLKRAPTFVGRQPNWSELTLMYKTICLPYSLKTGEPLVDIRGGSAKPLSRWIFRDINPFSTGFMPDKVTPSFLRAFIAYMENMPVQDKIKAPGFILVNKNKELVTSEELRKQFLAEISNPDVPKKLMGEGYQVLPDIRSYEGRYISCAIEVDSKGNKITKFSKLPGTFVTPTIQVEQELMAKFQESYEKMERASQAREDKYIAQAKGIAYTPAEPERAPMEEEIQIDDVSF